MNIIIAIGFGLVSLVISQLLVRALLGYLNRCVEESLPELKEIAESVKAGGANTDAFKTEIATISLVKQKRKKLWIFASLIGAFETVFFITVTVITLAVFVSDPFIALSVLVKFVAGWIAMKTIGNYQQWAGAVFGRIYYYIFIIGSLVNATIAVIAGYAIYFLILNP